MSTEIQVKARLNECVNKLREIGVNEKFLNPPTIGNYKEVYNTKYENDLCQFEKIVDTYVLRYKEEIKRALEYTGV